MPYADNRGLRIHYRSEGAGAPLVLQHGFSESIEDWYEYGYVDALKNNFRLILVDARGHGGSDKPHDPAAYALEYRVSDVVVVLDALRIEKAHYWGYSMGGWIGFGMANFARERVDHLVIGGQHPFARSMEPLRQMVRAGIEGGFQVFLAAYERVFGPVKGALVTRLRTADLEALLALAHDRPSLEKMLPQISVPCLLYSGEADEVCTEAQAASERIPRATFFSLPVFDHCQTFCRSDLVVPEIVRFLRSPSA